MNKTVKLIKLVTTIIFYKKKLAKFLKVPIEQINSLYKEINNSKFLASLNKKTNIPSGYYYLSPLSPFRVPLLYIICRLEKPKVVVETGVKDGYSSSFILFALKMNQIGKLYSIDLPNQPGQELEGDKTTGWLVPGNLQSRWQLIFGSSKKKLPQLLTRLKQIDIFFHDSDHRYTNMMFEFNIAWECLRPGGYLLSDDITENKAFADFIESKNCRSFLKLFKQGIVRKP